MFAKLREKTALSQDEFANAFGLHDQSDLAIGSRAVRVPIGGVRAYLVVIERTQNILEILKDIQDEQKKAA